MKETAVPGVGAMVHYAFAQADVLRREAGQAWDLLGGGADHCPSELLQTDSPARLRRYPAADDKGPVVLLVPAPIKNADIWDIEPAVSVVRDHLAAGCRIYLLLWPRPDADSAEWGLSDYADTMPEAALEVIRSDTAADRVYLTGHSLGGTLATLFAARHPDRVTGLTLLAAPLHFGPDVGALGRLVKMVPDTRVLTDEANCVPGTLLSALSALASPDTFVLARATDWLRSVRDFRALRCHLRVERWALDESPMPVGLFRDLLDGLYRTDSFLGGELIISGRRVLPADVIAPVACVVDERCDIVPPQSVLPVLERFGSKRRDLFRYGGDVGVSLQHVGMLVGRNAHRELWPRLLAWIRACHGGTFGRQRREHGDWAGGA